MKGRGSGFNFGYYDAGRNFVNLGSTPYEAITMSVDKNVTTDYSFIGCFHIKLGSTYESFQQAQNESAKYPDGFPAYYSGKFYVLVGNYKSRAEATEAIKTRGRQSSKRIKRDR